MKYIYIYIILLLSRSKSDVRTYSGPVNKYYYNHIYYKNELRFELNLEYRVSRE